MLTIRDLAVSYGAVPAVNGVSLEIEPGELRVILGANGAGKTTILKTLLGLLRPRSGEIRFGNGADLSRGEVDGPVDTCQRAEWLSRRPAEAELEEVARCQRQVAARK